jgi:starch-binding outer membrane protein, SusD/RagB family
MNRILSRGVAVAAGVIALAACSADRLNVPNFANPTPESIGGDPRTAIPFVANGILRNLRDIHWSFVLGTGILGREAYNYTSTEGRNTSGWLTSDVNSAASFGGTALWTTYYVALRNIDNLLRAVDAAPAGAFSDAEKSALRGFAHTMEALALHYLIATRNDLGVPVEAPDVAADPTAISPFVSRDSVFSRIVSRLDLARTELQAGGAAFPITLHAGFAGFNTPANFLRFNRGLAARVQAYRASLGTAGCTGGRANNACYQSALTALGESFINPTGDLRTGVSQVYSASSGDVANSVSNQSAVDVVAHAQTNQGVQLTPGGQTDQRYRDKVITLAVPKNAANPTIGVPTSFDFSNSVYATAASPIPVMRNEELILLRAEARYYGGDVTGALADLNTIRTMAGGLAPLLATDIAAEAAFLDELLYNRRWSLLFEGHRWVDLRRFGRLDTLPRDLANHIVATRLPVPQAECLARSLQTTPEMRGPGCA